MGAIVNMVKYMSLNLKLSKAQIIWFDLYAWELKLRCHSNHKLVIFFLKFNIFKCQFVWEIYWNNETSLMVCNTQSYIMNVHCRIKTVSLSNFFILSCIMYKFPLQQRTDKTSLNVKSQYSTHYCQLWRHRCLINYSTIFIVLITD